MFAFVLALSLATVGAFDGPVSRERLIGAIPPRFESLILIDVARLSPQAAWRTQGKVGAAMIEGDLVGAGCDRGGIDHRLRAAANQLGLVRLVKGGTSFAAPDRIGLGTADVITVLVTKEPMAALKDLVAELRQESVDGVVTFVADLEFCSGQAKQRHPLFISFLGQHTVVTAQRMEDILHVAKELSSDNTEVPKRWQAVMAAIPDDPPVVILRARPADDIRPPQQVGGQGVVPFAGQINAYGVVIPETNEMELSIYAETALKDADAIKQQFGGDARHFGFPPAHWEWTGPGLRNGIHVFKLKLKDSREAVPIYSLVSAFGIMIAI